MVDGDDVSRCRVTPIVRERVKLEPSILQVVVRDFASNCLRALSGKEDEQSGRVCCNARYEYHWTLAAGVMEAIKTIHMLVSNNVLKA